MPSRVSLEEHMSMSKRWATEDSRGTSAISGAEERALLAWLAGQHVAQSPKIGRPIV